MNFGGFFVLCGASDFNVYELLIQPLGIRETSLTLTFLMLILELKTVNFLTVVGKKNSVVFIVAWLLLVSSLLVVHNLFRPESEHSQRTGYSCPEYDTQLILWFYSDSQKGKGMQEYKLGILFVGLANQSDIRFWVFVVH